MFPIIIIRERSAIDLSYMPIKYFLKCCIIIAILSTLIAVTLTFCSDYVVHIDMVKQHTEMYEYSSFDEFKNQFNKQSWDTLNSDDLISLNHRSRIYAGIIEFNNIGMIMENPIEYLKAKRFITKYIKNKNIKGWYMI